MGQSNCQIKSIQSNAFSECAALHTVDLSLASKLRFIDQNAFSDCQSLTSVTLPDSIASVGASAFANCPNLRNIELSGFWTNLLSLGESAFQ